MVARKSPSELARFLLTRGVWLILVEVLIVSTSATFSPGGIAELGGLTLAAMQVIWAIGVSMIVLAGFQWLRRRACLVVGLAIVAGHNLLDGFWPASSLFEEQWPLWVALHSRGTTATVIDFLNTTKYPPSLAFLLMTLGPAAILCALADRIHGVIKNALVMFGRVPFAFYVAHVILIHALSVLLGIIQGFDARQLMTIFFYYPKGYGVGLPGVYVVWILVVVLLYPFCRWVASVKARRRDWWLSDV
jgi:uncharacterized membrane protein